MSCSEYSGAWDVARCMSGGQGGFQDKMWTERDHMVGLGTANNGTYLKEERHSVNVFSVEVKLINSKYFILLWLNWKL